jgi:hypothetical protein
VSVKNYTQSIIEELKKIKEQNVSTITVVIGRHRSSMFLNSPFCCLFHYRIMQRARKVTVTALFMP